MPSQGCGGFSRAQPDGDGDTPLGGIQCRYHAAHESDALASVIDTRQALPWPEPGGLGGDPIWMGMTHREAHVGVLIRSVYRERGSSVTQNEPRITRQNRTVSSAADSPDLNRGANSCTPSTGLWHGGRRARDAAQDKAQRGPYHAR